jgi:hypothetical protein
MTKALFVLGCLIVSGATSCRTRKVPKSVEKRAALQIEIPIVSGKATEPQFAIKHQRRKHFVWKDKCPKEQYFSVAKVKTFPVIAYEGKLRSISLFAQDQTVSKSTTEQVEKALFKFHRDFVDEMREYEWEDFPVPLPYVPRQEIVCKASVVNGPLASVVCLDTPVYQLPNWNYFSFNFWSCNGHEQLFIQHICKDNSECVNHIRAAIKKSFLKMEKSDIWDAIKQSAEREFDGESDGFFPERKFSISKSGLVFYLDDYLPRMLSALSEIKVSWNELDSAFPTNQRYQAIKKWATKR